MADPTETPVLENNALDQNDSATNQLPGWARDMITRRFKKLFGREYDLDKALSLLESINSGNEVADEDVIEIGLMYAHYLEHHQNSIMAAELLRVYMNQTSPTPPTATSFSFDEVGRRVVIPEASVRALPGFNAMVASNASVILERAIQKRLDHPDAMHPDSSDTFEKPDGTTESVSPGISPMYAGGTETIYFDFNIQLPSDPTRPIKQALGTITVNSKITVTSTPPGEGTSWTMSVDAWENWGYDEGNFEWDELSKNPDKTKDQHVAISLEDLIPSWIPGKKRLEKAVKAAIPNLEWMLSMFVLKDKYMDQVVNKVITLPNGSIFNPKEFFIYIESWSDEPSAYSGIFKERFEVKTP